MMGERYLIKSISIAVLIKTFLTIYGKYKLICTLNSDCREAVCTAV
jgi:hypothetical protein